MKKLNVDWKIKKNVFKNKSFRESIDFDFNIEGKHENKSIKDKYNGIEVCRSPSLKVDASSSGNSKVSSSVCKSFCIKDKQTVLNLPSCKNGKNEDVAAGSDSQLSGTQKSLKKGSSKHILIYKKDYATKNGNNFIKSENESHCIKTEQNITDTTEMKTIQSCNNQTIDITDVNITSNENCDPGIRLTVAECSEVSSSKQPNSVSLSCNGSTNCSAEMENCYDLSFWGLPDQVILAYKARNINKMFQWQYECLSMKDVLNGKNLVYSAPTSAGKTLVAEILMLKKVLETKTKAMMILPFVSVVREKVNYFKEMFQDSGIAVDGFMGAHRPPGGFNAVDIAICTIEKANNLINRLMEEKKLDDLGILAVDELHMLGDNSRGYLLELLLTKLLYNCKKNNINIQIIGMSATLPNLNVLSSWLQAELYHTDFRPVPLHEMYKVGPTIYDSKSNSPVRCFSKDDIKFTNDSDHTIYLTIETITAGNGVLIFCPSKNWCETLATSIAHEIYKVGRPTQTDHSNSAYKTLGEKLREHIIGSSLSDVLIQLKNSPAGLDSVLKVTVPFGVAFHHAGLTFDERDIIEGAFKQGIIKVLVATSTLSSGVNLPARRVLIRSPMFCGSVIDTLSYKQMVGRAGRKGIDSQGESILICKESERKSALHLVNSALPPVKSCLMMSGKDGLHASLKRAVIEVIASGVASTHEEVVQYGSCTLLFASLVNDNDSSEESDNVEASIAKCLDYLLDNDFIFKIEKKENDSIQISYKPSQLGNAVLASGFSPEDALRILKELQIARRCFVLENDLHLLYEVTPPYLSDQMGSLNWMTFLSLWEQLPEDFRRVGELVGVRESFIGLGVQGRISTKSAQSYQKLAIHQRFYAALALNDLIQEVPLSVVSEKYNCNKGILQSLQQTTSTFSGMLTIFCNKLGWHNMELLFSNFQKRVHFGIQQELCDLVQLSTLNAQRARLLYNAGFETVSSLAAADPGELELVLCNAGSFESEKQLDGEIAVEALQRREVKKIQITGKQGVNEREAAMLIIKEAQYFIKHELGIDSLSWKKTNKTIPSLIKSQKGGNNGSKTFNIKDGKVKDFIDGQSTSAADKDIYSANMQSSVKLTCVQETIVTTDNLQPQLNVCKKVAETSNLKNIFKDENKRESYEGMTIGVSPKKIKSEHNKLTSEHTININDNISNSINLVSTSEHKQNHNSVLSQINMLPVNKSNVISYNNDTFYISNGGEQDLEASRKLKVSESVSNIEINENYRNDSISIILNPEAKSVFKNTFANESCFGLGNVDNLLKELEETIHDLNEEPQTSVLKRKSADHDMTLNQLLLSQCAETGDVYYSEVLKKNYSHNVSFSEILDNISLEKNILSSSQVKEIQNKLPNKELTDKVDAIFDLSSTFDDIHHNSIHKPTDTRSSALLKVSSNVTTGTKEEENNLKQAGLKKDLISDSKNCSFDICLLKQNGTSQSTPKTFPQDKNYLEDINFDTIDSPDLILDSKFDFSELNVKHTTLKIDYKRKPNSPVKEDLVIDTSGDIFESESFNDDNPDKIGLELENLESSPTFENVMFNSCSEEIFTANTSFKIPEDHDSEAMELNICPETQCSGQNVDKFSNQNANVNERQFGVQSVTRDISVVNADEIMLENSGDIFEDCAESESILNRKGEQISFKFNEHSEIFKSWIHSPDCISQPELKDIIEDSPALQKSCAHNDVFETPVAKQNDINDECIIENVSDYSNSSDYLEPTPPQATHLTVSKPTLFCNQTALTDNTNEINNKVRRQLFQASDHVQRELKDSNCIVNASRSSPSSSLNNFDIIDVMDSEFENFLRLLEEVPTFSVAVGCEKFEGKKALNIGPPKLRGKKTSSFVEKVCIDDEILISGLSFCWCEKSYFINFSATLMDGAKMSKPISLNTKLNLLRKLFNNIETKTIIMYDMKSYCKVLWRGCQISLAQNKVVSCSDPSVAAWMLDPAAGQQSLQELVIKYCAEAVCLVEGFDHCRGSFGLQHWSSVCGRQRAATEAYISFSLTNILLKCLDDKKLLKPFVEIEMPSVLVLTKMEQSGLGFDLKQAMSFRRDLQKKQDVHLKKAYQLAGRKFNIMSSKDLSRILYKELKLNPPDANYSPMASRHLSLGAVTRSGGKMLPPELKTNKDCLEKIMHLHPLPKIIVGWRKLSFAVSKVLMPLLRENKFDSQLNMHRLYSTCFIYTVTGRINMHTPNLQFVPRDFTVEGNASPQSNVAEHYFQTDDHDDMTEYGVSLRNLFIPAEGNVLLSADYSQLELRILAHLSGDVKLRKSLNGGDDIFKQIAATWKNMPIDTVNDEVRQQAKKICYGIIYGMSAKTLSHQLKTTENDAACFMETFKNSYPGVTNYLNSVIENCRAKGYVTTLMGRRRYLPLILSESKNERAHAERQAVNTTIQGSAADIIKRAMIEIDNQLNETTQGKRSLKKQDSQTGFLVLQLHDELIYEVPHHELECVKTIVKTVMENTTKLSVVLPVNMHVGPTWGSMEDI